MHIVPEDDAPTARGHSPARERMKGVVDRLFTRQNPGRHVAVSPGVGKTHLAIALGRAAIGEGYSVLFVTAPVLVAGLAKAHADGRLEERLGFFAKPKLLIVDELGYLPFEPNAATSSFSSSRDATSTAA